MMYHIAPKKLSKEVPTGDGLYWWRRGPNFKPRWFDLHKGIAKWPSGEVDVASTMGGEWLPVEEPGPLNEPDPQ